MSERDGVLAAHPEIVGRDVELAAIADAAERAREGRVQVVLLRGPLGTGRTRLLDRAVVLAREGSGGREGSAGRGHVLRAVCSPERRSPFLPLLRALEGLPRGEERALGAVREAFEEAALPAHVGEPRDVRAAVEAVEEAVAWIAADELLVIAIDDAQWADAHTLELVSALCERARTGGEGKLFVVATVRDEPGAPAGVRALFGAGRRDDAITRIALGPLGEEEALRLAQNVGPLAADVARAAVRGSGGVPFFLVHALHAWRDAGAIALRSGEWRAVRGDLLERGVPGVAELLEARLAAALDVRGDAGRTAWRALAAVALYGGGLSLEVIARACGASERTEDVLDALAGIGVLTVDGPRHLYGFAQEMVRQAVLNTVRARPWALRLHRALLDAIAEAPEAAADAAFLARGYEEIGAFALARTWQKRAMEAAVAVGLFAEAAAIGERRAALAETPEERIAAQLDTARALVLGRRFVEAKLRLRALAGAAFMHAAEAARGKGAAAQSEIAAAVREGAAAQSEIAAAVRDRGAAQSEIAAAVREGAGATDARWSLDLRRRILWLQAARGLHEDAVDDALAADADAHGDVALRCEARLAIAGALGGDRGVAIAGEAVALAERAEPAIEYAARVCRAELIYASHTRDLELAYEDLSAALAIARVTASRLHQLQIESDLGAIEAERGQTAAAIERFARLAEEADRHGMRGERRRLVQNRAALLLREGRAREAAEAAAEAATLAREAGDPVLAANAWSIRADALRRAGDLEEALRSIDEAVRMQAARGDRMRALSLLRRAEIASLLGRDEEAASNAAQAKEIATAHDERWIAAAADLWETLRRARTGHASKQDVERAITAATAPDLAPRAFVRSLVEQARTWLTTP